MAGPSVPTRDTGQFSYEETMGSPKTPKIKSVTLKQPRLNPTTGPNFAPRPSKSAGVKTAKTTKKP